MKEKLSAKNYIGYTICDTANNLAFCVMGTYLAAYCTDILLQVAAINAALHSFNKVLLANHIRTCVADDIRRGDDEAVEELLAVLQKLMK